VDTCDVDALASTLLRLENDPTTLRLSGMTGQQLVKDRLCWESEAEKMLAVTHDILKYCE
jgi:hypothetical protein